MQYLGSYFSLIMYNCIQYENNIACGNQRQCCHPYGPNWSDRNTLVHQCIVGPRPLLLTSSVSSVIPGCVCPPDMPINQSQPPVSSPLSTEASRHCAGEAMLLLRGDGSAREGAPGHLGRPQTDGSVEIPPWAHGLQWAQSQAYISPTWTGNQVLMLQPMINCD